MIICAVDEYNEAGHLIYSDNFTGAYVRGKTREEALRKFPKEIKQYCRWSGDACDENAEIRIFQEKVSELQICDADSDVIFDTELESLTADKYNRLKGLCLKSARDFLELYDSIPDKDGTVLTPRKTFYGNVPITAREMYEHTKNVNDYYFGEIGVRAENTPDIYECRKAAFSETEKNPDFLRNTVYCGSYNEKWSLAKVMRRFIWHDRIHAKAMYKMAVGLCGEKNVANPFSFEIEK